MSDDKTQVVTKASAVVIGTELNQTYKIDALIGIGGMGEVFKGHNIQTGDPVAIKVVLPEFARDEMIFELFRKEARVLNHLSHDAIVRYYVFSLDRVIGRPYLAMEYVDGPSLAVMIKNKPLAPESFFGLLRRLADGLHKAHEAGVIHRDISPDNVILPDGLVERAKIIDFGIARSANVGGGTVLGGSFAGKYSYVSPEQLGLFGGEVTPKSDIYSLGLMMAAAVRGQPLDMSGSQFEVIEKRRSVPELTGIPKQFHAILAAMLQPDPANRPASMAVVRDWIDKSQPSVQTSNSDTKGTQQSGSLRNVAMGLGIVAMICIAGLGGWTYVQNHKPQALVQEIAPEVNTPKSQASVSQQNGQPFGAKIMPLGPPKVSPTSPALDQSNQNRAAVAPAMGNGPSMNNTPTQTQTMSPPSEHAVSEVAVPPKHEDTQVAMAPDAGKQPVQPSVPAVGLDLAALHNYVQTYGANSCFRANINMLTEKSAEFAVLGTQETASKFEQQFFEKAGYRPQITLGILSTPQCAFIDVLNKVGRKNGPPLTIKLNRNEVRGSNADTGVAGDSLSINVTGIADRNIYLFIVDHEGGIQNINRSCSTCMSVKDGEMNAALSLFSPADAESASAPPFYPELVFVAAASRPLNNINAQDAFETADFVTPLLKDSASADDFSMHLAFVRLKSK